MRADRYDVVAHMSFPLKGFILACLLSPSPSLFLSSPSPPLSLPAASVNYKTESFSVPMGCQTLTHTHIRVAHGLEFEWMSVSPVILENQTSVLLDWHPLRKQSRVDTTRGEHREQRRTPENRAGYDKSAV